MCLLFIFNVPSSKHHYATKVFIVWSYHTQMSTVVNWLIYFFFFFLVATGGDVSAALTDDWMRYEINKSVTKTAEISPQTSSDGLERKLHHQNRLYYTGHAAKTYVIRAKVCSLWPHTCQFACMHVHEKGIQMSICMDAMCEGCSESFLCCVQ